MKSTNCIHANKSLPASCSNIRNLLKPNGLCCLIELREDLYWYDLVFGLLEGWWLFEDGRSHAIAKEDVWRSAFEEAGFDKFDFSTGQSEESSLIRVYFASNRSARSDSSMSNATICEGDTGGSTPFTGHGPVLHQSLVFREVDGLALEATVHYPPAESKHATLRPIALLIHGGGHVLLSRAHVPQTHIALLQDAGFLPVSIDYRLCPEVPLLKGAMTDVRAGLAWARQNLPETKLLRHDVVPDGNRAVAVGWSTGGHLAMCLGWDNVAGVRAPEAILTFYNPSDYESDWWSKPNIPHGSESASQTFASADIREGIVARPIASYTIPLAVQASNHGDTAGSWMAPEDARSRIALIMNWRALTVPVLLFGLEAAGDDALDLELLDVESHKVRAISPRAHIEDGSYRAPTFLIHGSADDLVPAAQSVATYAALIAAGIRAELRVVQGAPHLFDVRGEAKAGSDGWTAVKDGIGFLKNVVLADGDC